MKKTSAKILALLFALLMAFSAFSIPASAAAPAITMDIPAATVGTDVTVTVKLSAGSNAASGNFTLQYDNTKLSVKSMTGGALIAAYNPTINPAYSDNSVRLVFAGTNALTSAGTLATIVFTPKAAGTATFSFTKFKLSDINGMKIESATATAGSMTISSGSVTTCSVRLAATVLMRQITNSGGTVTGAGTYEKGKQATITATPAEDYVFNGWYTVHPVDNKLMTKQYSNATQVITVNESLYLAALFDKAAVTTYTLSFDKNTTRDTAGMPSSVTGKGEVTIPNVYPEASGDFFRGWATTPNATAVEYQPGDPFNLTKNTTLYAVWASQLPVYTVYYYSNGGSVYPMSEKGNASDKVTLPTPSRVFYIAYDANSGSGAPAKQTVRLTCLGWSKSETATTAEYTCGQQFGPTAETRLYAVWAVSTDKISSTVPTRSGYTFVGWNTDKNATTAEYSSGSTVPMLETGKTLTVYAIWKQSATPTDKILHFDANGGNGAPADMANPTSIPNDAPIPTRSGYTFIQWNTKANGTGTPYNNGSPITLSGNMTLYAIWRENTTPANPTASAALLVGSGTTVDYKATVTVVAKATGVPAGYYVAIYDGNTQLAKGDNTTAQYTADKMTAGRTFTAKVVDANGAVQKDGSGADLAKNVEIGVKTGFFAKIAAFFRTIFGLLPKITIQP